MTKARVNKFSPDSRAIQKTDGIWRLKPVSLQGEEGRRPRGSHNEAVGRKGVWVCCHILSRMGGRYNEHGFSRIKFRPDQRVHSEKNLPSPDLGPVCSRLSPQGLPSLLISCVSFQNYGINYKNIQRYINTDFCTFKKKKKGSTLHLSFFLPLSFNDVISYVKYVGGKKLFALQTYACFGITSSPGSEHRE